MTTRINVPVAVEVDLDAWNAEYGTDLDLAALRRIVRSDTIEAVVMAFAHLTSDDGPVRSVGGSFGRSDV